MNCQNILILGFLVTIVIVACVAIITSFPRNMTDVYFKNMSDVKSSDWYDYFKCIYTDNQLQEKLPFSVNDLWVIQTKFLPESLKELKQNISSSPKSLHDLFTKWDPHVDAVESVFYIYQYNSLPPTWANSPPDPHFKLKKGMPSNSWVEIERGPDLIGGYTWFYYMPGTGNWFDLGKTIVFNDHRQAFSMAAKEGVKFSDPVNGGDADQLLLAEYFISKGYDTIQFTQRAEGIFKYEIFNLKNKQLKDAGACIPGIKTRGNLPCDCSSSLKYLNCQTSSNPCGNIILPNT